MFSFKQYQGANLRCVPLLCVNKSSHAAFFPISTANVEKREIMYPLAEQMGCSSMLEF